MVMFSHWLPAYNILPFGQLGVLFFFVLSGYLISGNLLYLKRSIIEKEITPGYAFGTFYFRRTLRIFPLYYTALLLIYLLARPMFGGNAGWYFAYVPNFLMFRQNSWPEGLTHFWSLGVEEQFYLIWPLLIFLVRWDRLRYLFISFIFLSILYKGWVFVVHGSAFHYILPWGNFDAFGVGALLAYSGFSSQPVLGLKKAFAIPLFLFFAAAGVVAYFVLPFIYGFFIAAASFMIIGQAQTGFKGLAGRILDNPVLRYLGKISYGIYVYHLLTPWLWRCITGREDKYPLPIAVLNAHWTSRPIPTLIAELLITVSIATISWYALEKPFMSLKDRLHPRVRPSLAA